MGYIQDEHHILPGMVATNWGEMTGSSLSERPPMVGGDNMTVSAHAGDHQLITNQNAWRKPIKIHMHCELMGFDSFSVGKSNSKRTCKLTPKQILVKNNGFSYSNSSLILPPKN
jgi:hypothetical protein